MSSRDPFEPVLGPGRGSPPSPRFARETAPPCDARPANTRETAPPCDARPANTRVTYRYRDADGFTTSRTVVLAGRYADGDVRAIARSLDEGQYFIPSQVGLEDLQGDLARRDADAERDEHGVNPADHVWHELDVGHRSGDIALTDELPTGPLTFAQLTVNFSAVAWDDSAVDLAF